MSKKDVRGSIRETAERNIRHAADRLGLDRLYRQRLLHPKERIELAVHPVLPNGKAVHISAVVVRHSDILGPAKGGIRMSPEVTVDDVTGLAMEMT